VDGSTLYGGAVIKWEPDISYPGSSNKVSNNVHRRRLGPRHNASLIVKATVEKWKPDIAS
jgi:hypothetical protein